MLLSDPGLLAMVIVVGGAIIYILSGGLKNLYSEEEDE